MQVPHAFFNIKFLGELKGQSWAMEIFYKQIIFVCFKIKITVYPQ